MDALAPHLPICLNAHLPICPFAHFLICSIYSYVCFHATALIAIVVSLFCHSTPLPARRTDVLVLASD